MLKTFRPLLVSVILILAGISAFGQTYLDLIRENPAVASWAFYTYPDPGNVTLTKAPKGFHPIYISHYGRHGSRYHASESFFIQGKEGLQKIKDAGLLTPTGESLYREFFKVVNEHDGMIGMLSPLGAREHRAIAQRMYDRFGEVFKKRSEVDIVSSPIQRCIISMSNFTFTLKDNAPNLQYTYSTGDRYMAYICKEIDNPEMFAATGEYERSTREATCRYDKLFSSIFTSPEKAEALLDDPQLFVRSVFLTGCICDCLDFLGTDIFKYFDPEELAQQATIRNNKFYGEYGGSKEWGDVSDEVAHDLLKDFIAKADAALAPGSGRAADLRFGHDSGLLPLMGLLKIDGMDVRYPMATAQDSWSCHEHMPMASNFQMIFYRNRKGETLVKMLFNEKETAIKAVPAYSGPYYRWEDLRDYFVRISSD